MRTPLLAAGLLMLAPTATTAETFQYDALGRLVAAQSQSGQVRQYSYDTADNVRQIQIGGTATTSGAAAFQTSKSDVAQTTASTRTGGSAETPAPAAPGPRADDTSVPQGL